MFLMTFFLAMNDVCAENELRPLRPTTHPGDPNLTTGRFENFRKLFLEKDDILALLKPVAAKRESTDGATQGTTLPLVNRTTAWVDVEIGGKKIGRIGPLTTGLIHDVEAGTYVVTFHVEHVQYNYTERIQTIAVQEAITPGNMAAQRASAADYIKPGFDDLPKPKGGNLKIYTLSASKVLEPELIPDTVPEETSVE